MRDTFIRDGHHIENIDFNPDYEYVLWEFNEETNPAGWIENQNEVLWNPETTQVCFDLCFDISCNFLLWGIPKGDGPLGEYDSACWAAHFNQNLPDEAFIPMEEGQMMKDLGVLTNFGYYL